MVKRHVGILKSRMWSATKADDFHNYIESPDMVALHTGAVNSAPYFKKGSDGVYTF